MPPRPLRGLNPRTLACFNFMDAPITASWTPSAVSTTNVHQLSTKLACVSTMRSRCGKPRLSLVLTWTPPYLSLHISQLTQFVDLHIQICYFQDEQRQTKPQRRYRIRPKYPDAPPPTGKEIAAIIFKDDPETRAKRFVYTFPRSGPTDDCDRPRFVPIWTPMYESLHYPLQFFHGEASW